MGEFTFERVQSASLGLDRYDVFVPGIGLLGWVWKPAMLREWSWRGAWQADGPGSFHATRESAAEAMLAARRRADSQNGGWR